MGPFCPSQVGYELKDEIERKFDKWQEPPPVKQVKPLPAPLDGQRKKRGGRRWALRTVGVGRRGSCTQLSPAAHPQVPQDEGAAGTDRDPEAGQPHELRRGQTLNPDTPFSFLPLCRAPPHLQPLPHIRAPHRDQCSTQCRPSPSPTALPFCTCPSPGFPCVDSLAEHHPAGPARTSSDAVAPASRLSIIEPHTYTRARGATHRSSQLSARGAVTGPCSLGPSRHQN